MKADPFYYATGFIQADSAFCTEDETKPEWVKKLRKYQLELAEPGLRGVNYIITAPTGSGKTHVASYVIYEHLRKHGYFFFVALDLQSGETYLLNVMFMHLVQLVSWLKF